MERNHFALATLCPCILLAAKSALAADTVETFDKGAADFELYSGAEGLGKGAQDMTVFSDGMVGFGVEDGVSGYFGAMSEANGNLESEGSSLYMGGFGTPVETDHFDLDLFLDFSGLGGYSISPGIELNLDHDPEMGTFGFYNRTFVPFYGAAVDDNAEGEVDFDIATTFGGYLSIAQNHQVLLEICLDFVGFRGAGASLGSGVAALGYNAVLSEYLELIAELTATFRGQNTEEVGRIPGCWTDRHGSCGLGASIGFIATLPQ